MDLPTTADYAASAAYDAKRKVEDLERRVNALTEDLDALRNLVVRVCNILTTGKPNG